MPSSLDLEAYIGNYTGFTRLRRLHFIAQQDEHLRRDALRLAHDEIKRRSNTALYTELTLINPELFPRDDAWVESVEKRAAQTLEKLEAELTTHKTSLVKENIRVSRGVLEETWLADTLTARASPDARSVSLLADGTQRPGRFP